MAQEKERGGSAQQRDDNGDVDKRDNSHPRRWCVLG